MATIEELEEWNRRMDAALAGQAQEAVDALRAQQIAGAAYEPPGAPLVPAVVAAAAAGGGGGGGRFPLVPAGYPLVPAAGGGGGGGGGFPIVPFGVGAAAAGLPGLAPIGGQALGNAGPVLLSLREQARKVMGVVKAFAEQRGIRIVEYNPQLHDPAIFNSAANWCQGTVSQEYIQARLMQLRDERKYIGGDLNQQQLITAWRTTLAAKGWYNVADRSTHHRPLSAYVMYYVNPTQKAVDPTAEIVGLAIWHGVNVVQDWAFCDAVTVPDPLITSQWRPRFFPDFASDAFRHVPVPLRTSLFNDPRSSVEIAVACASIGADVQGFDLFKLLLAFALASNNMYKRVNSALLQLPTQAVGNANVQQMLDLFGFGRVVVQTPTGQPWFSNGSEEGECVETAVLGKFGRLALDKDSDDDRWFLLTPVEAAIILDLSLVGTRGISCAQPGSLALQIGFDPRTGRPAYANDTDICKSGQFNFIGAENFDRAQASIGAGGALGDIIDLSQLGPANRAMPPPPPQQARAGRRRRQSRGEVADWAQTAASSGGIRYLPPRAAAQVPAGSRRRRTRRS